MEANLFDARLGIIDTVRGVLMDLADTDGLDDAARLEVIENMGDLANLIMEVLNLEVTAYDEASGKVTATLDLAPIQ